MNGNTGRFDEGRRPAALSRQQAQREDEFWQRSFRQEGYCERGFDYEDYAPAYCVGYAGCAQYGGTFEDAQRCLWANWVRIKGDSRLSPQQALPAIRAAWRRMARLRRREQPAANDVNLSAPGAPALVKAFSRTGPGGGAAVAAAG